MCCYPQTPCFMVQGSSPQPRMRGCSAVGLLQTRPGAHQNAGSRPRPCVPSPLGAPNVWCHPSPTYVGSFRDSNVAAGCRKHLSTPGHRTVAAGVVATRALPDTYGGAVVDAAAGGPACHEHRRGGFGRPGLGGGTCVFLLPGDDRCHVPHRMPGAPPAHRPLPCTPCNPRRAHRNLGAPYEARRARVGVDRTLGLGGAPEPGPSVAVTAPACAWSAALRPCRTHTRSVPPVAPRARGMGGV